MNRRTLLKRLMGLPVAAVAVVEAIKSPSSRLIDGMWGGERIEYAELPFSIPAYINESAPSFICTSKRGVEEYGRIMFHERLKGGDWATPLVTEYTP